MTPLVGLFFSGATLAEPDDLAPGAGLVGRPVWGRTALLANLELRLGLPAVEVSEAVRTQAWSRRLDAVGSGSPRFYSRSYGVDPVGTSRALLSWRDALVDAGWNGEPIDGGGERLDALSELEAATDLPPGRVDRLRVVEAELAASRVRPLDALDLAESRDLWSGRWRRVFALLEARGVPVRTVEPAFVASDSDTDLGRLQALLRGDGSGSPEQLTGDGSLVLLHAETSWELGHALAAMLRIWNEPSTAIIRAGEPRPLDFALASQGLASQGVASTSAWRPVLQVLPLAIELAFEPRDPYRVLELLTLPVGPFAGLVGNRLAMALAEAPGIGGRPWQKAKESLQEYWTERARRDAKTAGTDEAAAVGAAEVEIKERFARVAEWLEGPGCDPIGGAPRAALLAVADRVRAWLQRRIVVARMDATGAGFDRQVSLIAAALSQTQAFHDALSHDPRETLDVIAARQLVEDVSSEGHVVGLEVERAGRFDPVDTLAGLRCARNTVAWWHCVGGTEWRPSTQPWRQRELKALRDAGVALLDPAKRLAVETTSWRRAILAARKRLVLAMPRWARGQALEPHPVWDEIVARFRAQPEDTARITLDVQDVLSGRPGGLDSLLAPAALRLASLPLPEARPTWNLDGAKLGPALKHSASSVEALMGCPLQWVFRYRAGLRSGSAASIPSGPILNGKLGHRLVEDLHIAGILADPARVSAEVDAWLDRLIREEAAVLLRPGMTFERAQLKKQLAQSLADLAGLLVASGLVVDGVEAAVVVPWGSRQLEGRLDLLLHDAKNRDVVLDLKWGTSRYRELLKTGNAVQLAVYAGVRRLATGAAELPAAAYFSLGRGELLAMEVDRFATARTLPGPQLSETWTKLERTVHLVEQKLATGVVPVTGVRQALPLLEVADVPDPERHAYLDLGRKAPCTYCAHSAICGRAWEGYG